MAETITAVRKLRARDLIVVVLAALAFSALGARADAEARVSFQAWAQTAPVVTFLPEDGTLYVAARAGTEEARTFLQLDTAGLDHVTMARARLTLREADDGFLSDRASLTACAMKGTLTSDGQLSGTPPSVDCTLRTNARRDDEGEWTIPLALFADRAVSDKQLGLVVFPETSEPTATFRVAFAAPETQLVVPPRPTPSATAGPATTESTPQATGPQSTDSFVVPPATGSGPTDTVDRPVTGSDPAASGVPPRVGVDERLPSQHAIATPPEGRSTVRSSVTVMVALALGIALLLAVTPLRRRVEAPPGILTPSRLRAGFVLAATGVMLLLPLLAREAIVFKFGVVLIFFVAAIGLHVLVNWAGQLSLAHAGMVGLPAFSVLSLSELHRISPIYLLPVAVAIGAGVGSVVALPTLRARGLQVAIVTLLAGIAIDRYFFTQTWLVGSVSGRVATTPTLGPAEFASSRSLYPVLLAIVVIAAVAAWMLMHSKLARSWYWVRANPEAASVFGVPVVTYRVLAYAAGGAFAGLAGGLAVMWVQRLSPQAFPTTLSFTYLLIAVLAGPGFVGGLVLSTMVLQGGQQFATDIFGVDVGKVIDVILVYGGPVALISVITVYRSGFNGMGKKLMERFGIQQMLEREQPATEHRPAGELSLSLIVGVMAIAGGFIAIALAWRHSSDTNQLWVQNQEMLSGGVGGLGAIVVGVGLLIRDRLARNHTRLAEQLEKLLGPPEHAHVEPQPALNIVAGVDADAPGNGRAQARSKSGHHRTRVAE